MRRLRVSVLGTRVPEEEWPSFLDLGNVDLVRADSLEALMASAADLAVVFASGAEAGEVVAAFAARKDASPLTLLVESGDRRHPQARLMEALVRGKREWEGTFDAMEDPLAVLGQDGAVARANIALARSLGRPISDTASRHYLELLGAPDPEFGDPIAESLSDGAPRAREARFSALPKRRLVTTSLLRDGEGKARQLVVVLQDLSELEERQARMLQATHLAAIGRLAGGVAHEINTPLASIALRAERLRKNAEDPSLRAIPAFRDFPRHLEAIDADVSRCETIVASLLDFSRSRPPEARETDLGALAEAAVALVGYQMKLKQVELSLRSRAALPTIQADDGQLRQVIVGLLMNALDAVGPGGHVVVETDRDGEDRVRLTVADDGIGIPPENRDKIFSPFFTTKPVGSGMGLGLAVCHGIVTAHGGEIRVDSEVGRGTRVSMALPIGGARRAARGRHA